MPLEGRPAPPLEDEDSCPCRLVSLSWSDDGRGVEEDAVRGGSMARRRLRSRGASSDPPGRDEAAGVSLNEELDGRALKLRSRGASAGSGIFSRCLKRTSESSSIRKVTKRVPEAKNLATKNRKDERSPMPAVCTYEVASPRETEPA